VIPQRAYAATFELAETPATQADQAASSAAAGCVRRWPNSMTLRSPAARTMRAAFERWRRSSSSVKGMKAFVHDSTADVRVSMKFSSSGKGVPSP